MLFNQNTPYNDLPDLPPAIDFDTKELWLATTKANRLLAELKGYCQVLPNPNLLINTIILQESKDSSAIENIVTTQDELYRAVVSSEDRGVSHATKEVLWYREALYQGFDQLEKRGIITTNALIGIMQQLRQTDAGVRTNAGTKLMNPAANRGIYTPPEGETVIRNKLASLEKFINDNEASDLDPLIKMALIHYQFEAIHPFGDGNGRTGRILNVLYLVAQGLLTLPILYLSSYIIHHKSDYYRHLREVTEEGKWHDWVLFMVNAVAETSELTLEKIKGIFQLQAQSLEQIRELLPNTNARDISDMIFSYPYIKIKTLEAKGIAKRQTASAYLQKLAEAGILQPLKVGKEIYYINQGLMDLMTE